MGHADVSTTMNIYAHSTKEAKRSSARLLDKVIGGDWKTELFMVTDLREMQENQSLSENRIDKYRIINDLKI